jgi:hypothetical protein
MVVVSALSADFEPEARLYTELRHSPVKSTAAGDSGGGLNFCWSIVVIV